MAESPVAIIPAAGLGTRLLPATRTLPKELLPVGRRAALDWIALEAVGAGIDELILVTSPGKESLFRGHIEAPRSGRPLDDEVSDTYARLHVSFAVQETPAGLGDAVRVGRDAARALGHDDCLAVLLPDELHDGARALADLLAAHRAHEGTYLSAFNAHAAELGAYGVLDVADGLDRLAPLRVHDLIEKPAAGEAPSSLAVAGRYILDNAVLAALDEIEPEEGELRLSDAIALVALRGTDPVYAIRTVGRRFDIGHWDGYEAATVALRR